MAEPLPNLIEEIVADNGNDDMQSVAESLLPAEHVEIATLLESLPVEERLSLWEALPDDRKIDVLVEMRSDPREVLISATEDDQWSKILTGIDAEDLLELMDSLPAKLMELAFQALDDQQQGYFRDATQFPDEQIGHWISHDVLAMPLNAKVRDGLRRIRRNVPQHCDTIFLINRSGQFSAAVKLTKVFGAPEHLPLVELTEEFIPVIKGSDDSTTASLQVQRSGFAALPVVDDTNKLLGRVDILSASELVNENYERQVMATAGMDEDEDLFAPVAKSARSRALWLGINLLTAFLASWFIGLFEATLQQVVALAVLMPVVASMGGIAGSQTLTLIVRGLALGQVTGANLKALMTKELKVGGVNGVIWALVIGIVAFFWFSDPLLGLVICLAIFMNILAAALAGVLLPVVLDKLKIDPALSGSVILTTVTDIVGFVAFLGLGSLFLL
ncbi:MAG: magnesium transporter [Aestuariibacter sp.]|jgi:magnesium transporter|uniref:magnesium transporter n=1 Tax=Marisediminitalea TaxID=2662254 RepID=UPI00129F00F1|nr:magnesium transporter [Marisediminitalea aggregata]MCP3862947.1 magnesium transporter [Aestuariibacter sp.]MEC7470421.1 magnesium transporter [Pseudomonadota bacterium]BBO29685.1 magnesium transporter [Alteromonas sp. I4]MCP4238279.1 magnesium transporter [Aestuariibacter sp.]MCP4529346.1 magnesium transporter [Aestuariibacter sp.]